MFFISFSKDILTFVGLEKLWRKFNEFDAKQIAGLAPDCLVAPCHYDPTVKLPFYGDHGINSGVILMNLTRMRRFRFFDKAVKYIKTYEHLFFYLDQEVFNVMFYHNPSKNQIITSCKLQVVF